MYKVFIDHKPIVFLKEAELSKKYPVFVYTTKDALNLSLKTHLQSVDIDNPLQIVCEDPKVAFKEYFKGYKKIKAAGGIVKRKNKYLMIKRNGLWDIPKGKIDKNEPREIACVREIMEECGINGHKVVLPLTITRHVMKDKGRNAIKKTYWYLLTYDGPKETTPELSEGITKTKWASHEQLMGIRGRTYGSINHLLDVFKAKFPQSSDVL